MKKIWQQLAENLKNKSPGAIGALVGFVLALSLVIFGILKTLFLIAMTFLGYFLGVRYFRNRQAFLDLLDKILPPGMFR
ncbi:MAG: DUF2273 domain-containing protein [Saccharofermentanales bacterium]|jgi:uncharacterized membrane protein|nr:DUF2273 domain-containing protein [Clostridiaceae bacterium]